MGQASCQHGYAVGQADLVFLHDLHDLLEELCHVQTAEGSLAIPFQQLPQIFIQLALFGLAPEISQLKNGVLQRADVIERNASDRLPHELAVPFRQPSHHAHIDPDDLTIPDLYISGMGVGMEKTVIQDLLDVIADQLLSDLIQIVSGRQQAFPVVNGKAVNIFHDQYPGRRIFLILSGNAHVSDIPVVSAEFLNIGGFLEEIHLLLGNGPHFIQDHFHVDHILDISDGRQQADRPFQQSDIPGHDVINAFAFDFDDHLFPRTQPGPVDLGNRGGSERDRIDISEDVPPVRSVGTVDHFFDLRELHGRHIGIELHQLIAVGRRQNIRMQGHDLPQFNISGAQFLQDISELFGRDPSGNDFIFQQDVPHLFQPGPVVHDRFLILYMLRHRLFLRKSFRRGLHPLLRLWRSPLSARPVPPGT